MKEVIEELLYEQESQTLDFKSEQYKFIGAEPHEKCELLKDILAFANAWRRTDAYILIGVKESKGGRAEVVGVDKEIDDAQLQQFINQKVQRPINFSYHSLNFENKNIAVIKIGPQERPIYLTKDFGKLKKEVVYTRRGSSTDIASPDEISKMGAETTEPYSKEPKLIFGFADLKSRQSIGNETEINTKIINIENESSIPNYGTHGSNLFQYDFGSNKDYYRELAEYLKQHMYFSPIAFYIYNESNVVSSDINIELQIENPNNILTVCEKHNLPNEPSTDGILLRHNINTIMTANKSTTEVRRVGVDYLVKLFVEKVQPKQTIFYEERIYFGSTESKFIPIEYTIYSDNLSTPITGNLNLNINAIDKSIHYQKIIDLNK